MDDRKYVRVLEDPRIKQDNSMNMSQEKIEMYNIGPNQTSENLLQIWDIFLAGGWKEFYKCLLLIFQSYRHKIKASNYEEIMIMFFNIQKSTIFFKNHTENLDMIPEEGPTND